MAGADSEGWYAPALNADNPAPVPWTVDSLYGYLREGWEERHGAAAGPMLAVVQNLRQVPEADVRAIAIYTAALMGPPSAERERKGRELIARVSQGDTGANPSSAGSAQNAGAAALFAGACAICHSEGSRAPGESAGINVAFSSALYEPTPRNAIRVLIEGIERAENDRGPFMPSFAGALTDDQVIELVNYMRTEFAKAPAWSNVREQLRQVRNGKK